MWASTICRGLRLALGYGVILGVASAQPPETPGDKTQAVYLENTFFIVEVKQPHGLISRIFDKVSKIELITDLRLADNFRLLIPLPDFEGNYILGKEQESDFVRSEARWPKAFLEGASHQCQEPV